MLSEAPDAAAVRRPAARRLDDAVLASAFAGLEPEHGLLLAVSGGPDSVALLLLAARWAATRGSTAPELHVATVDHGLRPASRQEADMVAALAEGLGLPHTILTWTGPKPSTRVQERARAARYGLLADHARAIGAAHILTAHHADDQAETVLLRLGRGSGLAGLAGMSRCVQLAPDLRLVRPLLDLDKATLVAVCRAEAVPFVDDPSNHDPASARGRLRRDASRLAALGLDTPGLSRLAQRLARADAALEAEADRVETRLVPVREPGSYRVDLTAAALVAEEIAVRLLRRAVTHVAGGATIRLERLERLTSALWSALAEGRAHRATLAGTRVALGADKTLVIQPESPRRRGVSRPGRPY